MLRVPSPRAHLAGTLALIDAFERITGGHPQAADVRALLDRPGDLPAEVSSRDNTLKYDAYLARGASTNAWGIAVNDRWDADTLRPLITELAERWGYDLSPYHRLREAVRGASPALTTSFGFDAADRRPRFKLYLQEDVWNTGVGSPRELASVLEHCAPGCRFPSWLAADRSLGVITMQFHDDGQVSLKAYVGGASPGQAIGDNAPSDVHALADAMAQACPLADSWYYLTVRMVPGADHRYAINKIYNHVSIGFDDEGPSLDDAWADVGALFRRAGRKAAFAELRSAADALPGVRVVPTATALEHGATSADVYCGAWQLD